MRIVFLAVAVAISLLAQLPLVSQAAEPARSIELKLSGTTFLSPPQFIVEADGQIIGRGQVEASYDAAKEGALATLSRDILEAHSQTFSFEIPEEKDPATISMSLTNDRWGGPENPSLDRDLYILSVKVGEQPITSTLFSMPEEGASIRDDGVVIIYRDVAVKIQRPPRGWFCIPNAVTVSGFPSNSAELSPAMHDAIASAATQFGNQSCEVVVTGYSSVDGPSEWNMTLARERARSVADALIAGANINADQVNIEVKGPTSEFGQTGNNRRVVISTGEARVLSTGEAASQD